MELKEFSHKGEAIEKEIKKEFQFMYISIFIIHVLSYS